MSSTTIDRLTGLNSSAAIKVPCVAATTAAITLSGLQTIDGIVLAADDRVLVKDQADNRTNGIYLASTGIWNRAPDFDDNRDALDGTKVIVAGGTNEGMWDLSLASNPLVLGTSALVFTASKFYAGAVTRRQVILALVDASNPSGANVYPTIVNAIDPLAADAASAEWLACSPMAASDSLYTLIQTTTGWSGAQMTTFMTLARSKSV